MVAIQSEIESIQCESHFAVKANRRDIGGLRLAEDRAQLGLTAALCHPIH